MEQLPSGVIGIERTQNVQGLLQLYSDANVFINPTYADTFPTVNLEALACGTPVITYRTGGSPEAVSPETGVVVEQGDVAGMADAIREICDKGSSTILKPGARGQRSISIKISASRSMWRCMRGW